MHGAGGQGAGLPLCYPPTLPQTRTHTGWQETGDLDLLFFTNTESSKASDIHSQPLVNVAFLNGSGEWASVSGLSEVVTDRELVRQHYSSSLKAWLGDLGDGVHDGGQDDPRIGVIRVRTIAATYSLASKNALGRAVEVAQGAVTGKPASIHRLRELSEAEAGTWRESN